MTNEFEQNNGLDLNDPSDAQADTDGDGRTNLEEFNNGTDISRDDIAPNIEAAPVMSVSATGDTSEVALQAPVAIDGKDGALTATINNAGPYKPGRHILTWTAIDAAGNKATVEQILDVYPQVSFVTQQQAVAEGSSQKLTLKLNGDSPVYPVEVIVTVSDQSTVDEADTQQGFKADDKKTLLIEAGEEKGLNRSAEFTVVTKPDNFSENDESLIFNISAIHQQGWQEEDDNWFKVAEQGADTTLTISDNNVAPVVSIRVSQDGVATSQIDPDKGLVTLKAEVYDSNAGDTHQIQWRVASLPANTVTGTTIVFDPSNVPSGDYRVEVEVIDSGNPPLSDSAFKDLIVQQRDGNISKPEPTAPADEEKGDSAGAGGALYLLTIWLLILGVITRRYREVKKLKR